MDTPSSQIPYQNLVKTDPYVTMSKFKLLPGPESHDISVLNHKNFIIIFTMARVLIMALYRNFRVKLKVKFFIFF